MEIAQRFSEWINTITQNEIVPVSVIGFYFGIFESADGYQMHLAGTDCFDEEDEDWATEVVFEPADKYFILGKDFQENAGWQQVQANVEKLLSDYVDSDIFPISFLKNAQVIATGFDDGNLSVIYRT